MPSRSRLDSACRSTRLRASPWSAPASTGLKVFVVICGRLPVCSIQSPIQVSLRPPPYASAVSNQRSPTFQAASITANACSRVSPLPKNAGAEPMPPKLPQPRTTRMT